MTTPKTKAPKAPKAPKTPKIDVEKLAEEVEEAHTQQNFNAAEWYKGGGVVLATDKVEVFTDLEASLRISEIDIEIDALAQGEYKGNMAGIPANVRGPLDEEREELATRLYDTRQIFHVRTISPLVDAGLTKKAAGKKEREKLNSWDGYIWHLIERMRKFIVKIEWPGLGGVDEHEQTHEEMNDIFLSLPESMREKLVHQLDRLSVAGQLADQRSGAGFRSGDADVAGES